MKKKNEPKIWIVAMVFMALMVTLALAVLAIGIVGVTASGPTYVSGIISSDTTWTAADSPYIVTGNILVEEGVTLTIEPDVAVKFNSAKAMQIGGELIARGTEAELILFTSNLPSPAPGDWVNILFADSSVDATYDEGGNYLSGSIMQYCTVEYGGGSDTPAIKIVSSSPFIDQCTISNNANQGIDIEGGSLKISYSTVTNNSGVHGGGISVDHGMATITNNIVRDNSAAYGSGIHVYSGTATISNNTICNNSGEDGSGIYIGDSTVSIIDNIICNNLATGCGYGSWGICGGGGGIHVSGSRATISGNIVCNNLAMGGGGGALINQGEVTFSNNTILNNSAGYGGGIYVSGYSVVISGNIIRGNSNITILGGGLGEGDTGGGISVFGHPTITHNNIHDNTLYDVYNSNSQSSPHVNATNNWWGTTDEATIQAHIYDWYDDASLGIVDYIPYLTEPITPENIPPIASFSYAPENPIVNQIVTFDASASYDLDGTIVSYEWEFGDGNSATEEIVKHSYVSSGGYTVNLTVTDDKGATGSTHKTVTVALPLPPTISIFTDKNTYSPGDTMQIKICIKNSGSSRSVMFGWWLTIPKFGYADVITYTPMTLPEDCDDCFGAPIPVVDWGDSGFAGIWGVGLFEPTTSEVIDCDTAAWNYKPSVAMQKKTQAEITNEITKEIERVELPA